MRGLLNDKVQVQSLVDAVAERLEAAIVGGMFEPGSKLSEQALAKSLGVSRGALREAIRRLEGRKLLERTPNIGVRVATLSLEELSEILEVQEALQGMACALAAKHMDDAEIAALKSLVEHQGRQQSAQAGKVSANGSRELDLDLEFHLRIARGGRNKHLAEMLTEDLSYILWGYHFRAADLQSRWARAVKDHKEIVAALARRDPVAAEQKMREHIRSGRLHMEAQLAASLTPRAPEVSASKTVAAQKKGGARAAPRTQPRPIGKRL